MATTNYQAKFFAYALTREGGQGVERLQQSLLNATVDLNPHQVEAALFALCSPISKGVLLADEVGLGKTIEAGLVLCQLWAERKRKILVVCPASLRKQWQCELEDKFNLPCEIVDTRTARALQKEGFANPYTKPTILISSYQYAAKSSDDLKKVQWDAVVMDEAHKLRNSYRQSNKVGQALRWALEDRRKLLLTATPLQNSLTELYGIATLLDDTYFGDLPSFRSRYVNAGGDIKGLKTRMSEFSWRTLRKDVEPFVKYTKRFPITESFECTDRENEIYEDVSAYLQDETTYAFPQSQRSMLTLLVRKVLSSSSVALAGTLETILNRLKKRLAGEKAEVELLTLFEDDPDLLEELAEDLEDNEEDEQPQEEDIKPAPDEEQIDIQKLEDEIALVEDLIRRIRSIGTDKKTQHLLLALEKGWVRLKEIGAEEKAVVFTESRRTMEFLKNYLETNGYAGEVVCFSGGGKKDPTAEVIYQKYRDEHPEDKTSKAVMIRHALIDAFQKKAKIMIATEAGAEGINLQFCSMVVNYDLPWNPQRVEQRIGRCHRYGQKCDVVVVNFLNTRNAADVRVYELLEQKFRLFEGLFGASNGILGAIDSEGKSFERRINDILQSCRTPEEIKKAFDKLQDELQDVIAAKMETTRQAILENLDDDVRKVLKIDYGAAKDFLSEGEDRFMSLTKHVLKDRATFPEDDKRTFNLTNPPQDSIAPGIYTLNRTDLSLGTIAYRPNCDLGEWALSTAKDLETPYAEVTFDITNYKGKISVINNLKGKSGYLRLENMKVVSLDSEDFLLFTGFTEDGAIVPPEVLENLFKLDQAISQSTPANASVEKKLETNARLLSSSTLQKSLEQNNLLFKEKLTQLDRWVEDQIAVAEHALQTIKNELRAARHEQDIASNQEELAQAAVTVETLEKKKRKARQKIDEVEEQAMEDRGKILAAIKRKMVQNVNIEPIFTIKWRIV